MSARTSRRRTPIHGGRKTRPPRPNPSPHRPNPPSNRHLKPSQPIETLNRCSSEPILWRTIGSVEEDDPQILQSQVLIFRPKTCADVLASPLRSLPASPYSSQSFYREDSKVVVNVTVEGSPGPVRAMVSLGASVEETIKLVVDKYSQEGRSPRLHRDAASTFELHQSYFSLERLNKWERIGDVGSRSFLLRRSCSSNKLENEEDGWGRGSEVEDSRTPLVPSHLFYSFIARRISKIGRRTRKIWKILGCIGSS